MSRLALYADSARGALDVMHPARAVPYLAEVARLATSVRVALNDTATVPVTMTNRGPSPATLVELTVWGSPDSALTPIVVPPDSAAQADAPVTLLQHPTARLLTWPNRITRQDWAAWAGGRAQWVPSRADSRYSTLIEVHDLGQPENRNAILVARVGKGTLIYLALTLDEQIAGGVPGALRLLVNLLCAGLAAAP